MISGIITALEDEIKRLVERMSRVTEIQALKRTFYRGEISGQEIVAVGSGVGKVRASACSQFLIDKLGIEQMIVFGLAGGLDSDLRIGDLVISKMTIMHDYYVAGEGVNEDISIGPIEADPNLLELALKASKSISSEDRVRLGIILTGDESIDDSQRKDDLRRKYNGDCVEMEGAAVALTCSLNLIPFVIVRSISDFADETAHQQFEDTFGQAISMSTQVVLEMLRLMSEERQKL
jgi:adenosylhomocysteine nucleosidase